MGSFDKLGFFSKLPISFGDEIVMFVCANTSSRRNNLNSICDMTESGITPIAAPFFCQYNDYGSGQKFIEDANYILFKEKFGMTVEEFDRYCCDLAGYTLDDLRNGLKDFETGELDVNEYHHTTPEDFKKMINIIESVFHPMKFKVPKHYCNKYDEDAKIIKKQYDKINDWETERFNNTGLMTIIELRSVYDAFISAYKNNHYYVDASETYDLMSEYISGLKDMLGNKFKGLNFLVHRIDPMLDTLTFFDLTDEEEKRLDDFMKNFSEKYPNANGKTLLYESCLHCTIRHSFEDHALYDNFTGDMMSLKDIMLDYMCFIRGFGFTHSSFAPSEVASQTTEFDILIPVYEKMLEILKENKRLYESNE